MAILPTPKVAAVPGQRFSGGDVDHMDRRQRQEGLYVWIDDNPRDLRRNLLDVQERQHRSRRRQRSRLLESD
jgi:hypothetical protein